MKVKNTLAPIEVLRYLGEAHKHLRPYIVKEDQKYADEIYRLLHQAYWFYIRNLEKKKRRTPQTNKQKSG